MTSGIGVDTGQRYIGKRYSNAAQSQPIVTNRMMEHVRTGVGANGWYRSLWI